MKVAFNEANEANFWSLQENHWKEITELQKAHHEEQQQFILNIQKDLEAIRPKTIIKKKKLSTMESTKDNKIVDNDKCNDNPTEPTQDDKNDDVSDDKSEEDDEDDDDAYDYEEEMRLRMEEQERFSKEQQELQAQLEEQQEAEKLLFEQERAKEQEHLKVELEVEKKEVMATKIEEDESALRLEYIRKIANETGLSEELIAAQLDRIGMPSYMC